MFFSIRILALTVVGSLILSSCASVPTASTEAKATSPKTSSPQKSAATEDRDEEPQAPVARTSEKSAAEIENLTIDDVIRIEEPNTQNLYDNSRYDFPIMVNSRVEGWIDYFTSRGRPHMEKYLGRSSRYIPIMKEILKNGNLPEDLVYLALIESGFNLKAKSRARAVGPWQFIKGTGQRYGLRVNAWIDERRDPIRSTEAASRYLKDLYLMFESWYLAASAYNAGENKILRTIGELKTNNYWKMCETKFLRRETKDYVPKLIAAAIIAKNPGRYGFDDISFQDPLEFDTISVDFPLRLKDLANLIDTPIEDLEELNPSLRRSMIPPGASFEVRIPKGTKTLAERGLSAFQSTGIADIPKEYVVKKGETLASIARKHKVKVAELSNVNNLSPKEKLVPGTTLLIPSRGIARVRIAPRPQQKRGPANSLENYITHSVQRGESLWSIAEKYNVTVQDIFRWNSLHRSQIQAGKQLRIRLSAGE